MNRVWGRRAWTLAVLAALGPLPAQVTVPRTRTAAGEAPTREASEAFVRHLDELVNAGDWTAFRAALSGGRQSVFAFALNERIREMELLEGLRSSSEVLDYFTRGDAGVAVVKTRLRHEFGPRDLVTYTVLGNQGGAARGLFIIESHPFAARMKATRSDSYECPACNFRVSFGADWLAVPRCPARSGCMEAVWLVSLTHDLHIDVAVHVGEKELTAEQVLANCLRDRRFSQWVDADEPGAGRAWRPTCTDLPESVTGYRYTTCCKGDLVAELNMVTLGRLRYLMVVRGPAKVLAEQRREVNRILDSFTVLDPELAADRIAAVATHVHSGRGEMRPDNLYRNPTAQVELRGPAGWTPVVRAGGCLFDVSFSKGDHNRLQVRAWGGGWTQKRVEGILRRRADGDPGFRPGSAWSTGDGFRVMEIPIGQAGIAMYAFRDDLLLIFNGFVQDPKDLGSLGEAMRAVRSLSPK